MAPVKVSDIRQSSGGGLDLKAEIVKALPGELAGVAVWTDENNRLFGEHCQMPQYYLFHREKEILENHGAEICSKIPTNSVLIELGSGVLTKTKLILSELERQGKDISYFAVDIALEEMENQLMALDKELSPRKHVNIAGLLGTYDDCAEWVQSNYPSNLPKSITFLFLGSTAGNVYAEETSAFIKKFATTTTKAGCDCRFLFTLDGATDREQIETAYSNLPGLDSRRTFAFNSLESVNKIVGHKVFDPNDWDDEGKWNKEELFIRLALISRRDVTVRIDDKEFVYRKGDRLQCIMSAKWPETFVREIVKNGSMRIAHLWKDRKNEYGFYFCVPDLFENKPQESSEKRPAVEGTVAY